MKKTMKRVVPMLLLVAVLFSIAVPAGAEASSYFISSGVTITAKGGGNLQISLSAQATDVMKSLGASYVAIKEKQSNGTYCTVKTYTKATRPSLVQNNRASFRTFFYYQGKAGKTYQVFVTFRAENASGVGTITQTSRNVVAS